MKIVNLTPHTVVVFRDDSEGEVTGSTGVGQATKEGRFSKIAEIAPTGVVARARQIDEVVGELEISGYEVPLISTRFGEPTDLPEPSSDTCYVVSIVTAQAAKAAGRITNDLLVTSDPVRDETGKIIGSRKFAVI